MRMIEDLRDLHKGKEIWVVGCGPSLDEFPASFFKDKITIALNRAFAVVPDFNFVLCCHNESAFLVRDKYPHLLRKCIFLRFPYIFSKIRRTTWPDDFNEEPIWMVGENFENGSLQEFHFEEIIRCIKSKKKCVYKQMGTVAHSAIQAAAILGARKITLAGCEHHSSPTSMYAKVLYHLGLVPEDGPQNLALQTGEHAIFKGMRDGTRMLARVFGREGITVRRYFYGKGYESIA